MLESKRLELRKAVIFHALKKCSLFSGFEDEELRRVIPACNTKSLRKKDILCYKGDVPDGLYVVHTGRIIATSCETSTRRGIINIFTEGDFFPEWVFAGRGVNSYTAIADQASLVIHIPILKLQQLIFDAPGTALCLMDGLGKRLNSLMDGLIDVTHRDSFAKFASWLVRQCGTVDASSPNRISWRGSRRNIAGLLGLREETLSRVIHAFVEQNYILLQPDFIFIRNCSGMLRDRDLLHCQASCKFFDICTASPSNVVKPVAK